MNTGSDIYALLKDEHESILSILRTLLQSNDMDAAKRKSYLSELKDSIARHNTVEDEGFYSALLQHDQRHDLIQNGKQEHQRMESLLHELNPIDTNDPQWRVKLQSLNTLVEQHVREVENQVFTRARTVLPAGQAEELGRKFEHAKSGQRASQAQASAERYAPQATASAREAGERVRHEAQHLTEEAKTKGRSMLHDQQRFFADQIGSIAEALHHTAQKFGDQDQGALAQYTNQAAEGLEHVSHSLRDRDIGSVVGQVEDFARRQPMAFIGGAAVLGFLASRFLKSSAEHRHASYRPAQAERPSQAPYPATTSGFAAEDAAAGVPSVGQPTTASPYGGQ